MTEERLKRMFDEAEPDEATLDRMWAVIDAAYDEMAAEEAGEGAAQAAEPQPEPQPQWRVRRGGRRWIPAVAAVLVVAVGIGVVLGSGAGMKTQSADAPNDAGYVVYEVSSGATEKSSEAYESDGAMANAPAPEPTFAPDSAAAPDEDSLTFLTGDDGRRYAARTLIVAVQDCDVDALCAKYGVSLKDDWDQWIVVELDHDATVAELAQLAAAIAAEPGVLEVEYDWETVAF